MKKLILLFGLLWAVSASAQGDLRFREDGTFRILQFTDMHLRCDTEYRLNESRQSLDAMEALLREEKPDLAVFTGDNVTGKPAAKMWPELLSRLAASGVPYCLLLGNHDAEQELTREEIAALVMASKGTLNRLDARKQLADVVLPVVGRDGKTAAVLYCMDSHDYSPVERLEGYGWFTEEQIAWYRARSRAYTAAHDGTPLPSLAFFHIPLCEFRSARLNHENPFVGRAAEDECPGALNTGMFAAMALEGDICGLFVGHDHDNDYVVVENGIAMAYGRYSGGNTVYNNLPRGVRVIVLREGERGFTTWIRERDGRRVDHRLFDGKKLMKP